MFRKRCREMTTADRHTLVIYCSPAGSTRHIAEVIVRKLESLPGTLTELDLGKSQAVEPILSREIAATDHLCLYIGSPVYASHAVPPVMDLISTLPVMTRAYAVPFVTWGGVTSGIALYEMGKQLQVKGYRLLGAAKVLAYHCMMWRFENPLGEAHPNSDDDQMIEGLVAGVANKLQMADPKGLPLSKLAYPPPAIHRAMEKRTFEKAKREFPKRQINEDLCTRCGVCQEVCPAGAVVYEPHVQIGPNCFFCFNCVRHCPEGAIDADLSEVKHRAPARARQISEDPRTQVFL